jgi:hypothetical protein
LNVLERKGVTSKAEVLEEMKALQAKTPTARYKHHERRDVPDACDNR